MKEAKSPNELSVLLEDATNNFEFPEKPELLYQPMQYILRLGGKRLRPLLALMSYNLFKDDPEAILMPSLSVELFHNFSLIHDDIMDKAPVRRGEPTVHIKWNDNVGILSGDGMLVMAYKLLEPVDQALFPGLFKDFNQTAIEVCEGQQLDMDFESRSLEENPVSEAEYLNMIRLKTSVLFGFSMKLGASLAGRIEDADMLYEAGVHMGLAFQLQDDLLDLYGGDKFGKIPGGDIINAKKTLLLVKTMELASTQDAKLLVEVLSDSTLSDSDKVKQVQELYDQYGIPDLVKNEIDSHLENFQKTLEKVGSERSATLVDFVMGLANRAV